MDYQVPVAEMVKRGKLRSAAVRALRAANHPAVKPLAEHLMPWAQAVISPWGEGSFHNTAKVPGLHTSPTVALTYKTRVTAGSIFGLADSTTATYAVGDTLTGDVPMDVVPVLNSMITVGNMSGKGAYTGTTLTAGWWEVPTQQDVVDLNNTLADLQAYRLVSCGVDVQPLAAPLYRSGNIHTGTTVANGFKLPVPYSDSGNAPFTTPTFPAPAQFDPPDGVRDVPDYAYHDASQEVMAHSPLMPNNNLWQPLGSATSGVVSANEFPIIHMLFENAPLVITAVSAAGSVGHNYTAALQFDIVVILHLEGQASENSPLKRVSSDPCPGDIGFVQHVANLIQGRPSSTSTSKAQDLMNHMIMKSKMLGNTSLDPAIAAGFSDDSGIGDFFKKIGRGIKSFFDSDVGKQVISFGMKEIPKLLAM